MRKRIALIVACLGVLAATPEIAARAARVALETWALRVVPAMFPYMMLARLLARVSTRGDAGASRGAAIRRIALTGWTAGNPVGACLAGMSAQAGAISPEDALRAALVGSACSPAFILGALGCGHGNAGILLLTSHWLGIVCGSAVYARLISSRAGMAYNRASGTARSRAPASEPREKPTAGWHENPVRSRAPASELGHALRPQIARSPSSASMDIAAESAQTMLTIGGYMVLATVAAAYMQLLLLAIAPGTPALVGATLHSLLEMAGGTLSLMTLYPSRGTLPLTAMALALGGLSITLQSLAMLRPAGVKPTRYVVGKLIQGAFAYAICAALEPVFCASEGVNWDVALKWLGAGAVGVCAAIFAYYRARAVLATRCLRKSAPVYAGRVDM